MDFVVPRYRRIPNGLDAYIAVILSYGIDVSRSRTEEENRTPYAFRFASIRCKSKGDIRVDERTGSQRVLETR